MSKKNRGQAMEAIFTTNTYKVLESMYDNTLSVADKEYCPLSQAEIADDLGLSRVAVNKIYKDLADKGYIEMIARGKWKLSKKAEEMVRVAKQL